MSEETMTSQEMRRLLRELARNFSANQDGEIHWIWQEDVPLELPKSLEPKFKELVKRYSTVG